MPMPSRWPTYEISSGRNDVPTEVRLRFQAASDRAAKLRFEREFVANPDYDWDHLKLERVTKKGRRTLVASRVLE